MPSPYWQMIIDGDYAEVPDTDLDWLRDQPWFQKKIDLYMAVDRELKTRKRSHYHVADRYGRTLED